MKLSLKQQLTALGFYGVVALAVAAPTLLGLATVIIGDGGDPWQTMWRFEDQESRILNAEFWKEFFGGGEPRLVNYSTLPWMPLQLLFGQPLAYNLVWLISFALSGYGMYLLVRYLLKTTLPTTNYEVAAIVSGLYYMLLPFHVAHSSGHFGAMQLQWLPLAILAFLYFVQRPTVWNTVGLGAVLAVQSWTEHHYMLWLALFFVLYSVFFSSQIRQLFSKQLLYVGGLGLLLLIFVVLPYWPTIRLAAQPTSLLELGQEQTIRFSADLLSYIVPASFHPLWGGLFDQLFRQQFTGNAVEGVHYVGVIALLLVIFFRHLIPRRQYTFWISVAVVFFVISLGPRLHVLGRVLPLPLPYALIDSVPPFSAVRAVGRAGVMVGLSLAVVLGWTLATQVRRQWVYVVVGGLLLLDFLVIPVAAQSTTLSPAYERVAAWAGQAIIELPAATNYTLASRALYASHAHGKRVVGSIALERAEDEAVLQEVRSLPALRHLLYLRTGQLRLDRPDFFDQSLPETLAETFTWLDAGGIVVHRDSLSPLQLAAINNFLVSDVGLVAEEFADVVVYPIGNDIRQRGDGVFLARDSRWANVGFDEERGSTFAEIPTEAGLTLYNITDVAKRARLSFTIAPESHGSLLFVSDTGTEQLQGAGGDVLEVDVELPSRAKAVYVLRNQLTEKVIIQDPRLVVEP